MNLNHQTPEGRRAIYALDPRFPLRDVRAHMRSRCYDPKDKSYANYGGRGITVCAEWLNDLEAFRAWALAAGYRHGLQIDRIDVNGNYEPANCRFVTSATNNRNRRNNKLNVESVREIRQMLAEGFTNQQVADKFSVHRKMIHNIKNQTAWANA